MVHGRTYEEHSGLAVTLIKAPVTARVTCFVFRTVMPTPLLSVLNLVCPLPNWSTTFFRIRAEAAIGSFSDHKVMEKFRF